MAIIRAGLTAPASSAGTTDVATISAATPAGVQTGDTLFAQIMHRVTGTSTPQLAGGWTLLGNWTSNYDTGIQTMEIWTRTVVAAEPASHGWDLPATSGRATAGIVAYRGATIADIAGQAADTYSESNSAYEFHAPGALTLDEPLWHGRLLQFAGCVYADTSTSQGWALVDPAYGHATSTALWGSQRAHRVYAGELTADVTADAGDIVVPARAGHYIGSGTTTHAWQGITVLLRPTDLEPAPARASDFRLHTLIVPTEPAPVRLQDATLGALVPTADYVTGWLATPHGGTGAHIAKQIPAPAVGESHHVSTTNAPPVVQYHYDPFAHAGGGWEVHTVWWKFTAATSDPVSIRVSPTGSDPIQSIYLSAYTELAPVANRYLMGDELSGIAGTYMRAEGIGLVHDKFADAMPVLLGDSGPWVLEEDTTMASIEPGEATEGTDPEWWWRNGTHWYRYTPLTDGTLTIRTEQTTYPIPDDDWPITDTLLAVYTGDDVTSLTQLAFNDDTDVDYFARIDLPVTAGTTYSIASGAYASGRYRVLIEGPATVAGATVDPVLETGTISQADATLSLEPTAGTTYYLQVATEPAERGGKPGSFEFTVAGQTPTPVVAAPAFGFDLNWSAGPVQWIEAPPIELDLHGPVSLVAENGHTAVDVIPVEYTIGNTPPGLHARLGAPVVAFDLTAHIDGARPVASAPAIDIDLDFGAVGQTYIYLLDVEPLALQLDFSGRARRGLPNQGRDYRWELFDPVSGDHWTMPINPDSMTSPHRVRENVLTSGAPRIGGGRSRTVVNTPTAKRWEFGGVIRSKDHYDHLLNWSLLDSPVHVTDHLERTWEIVIEEFAPEERRPTYRTSWRFRYTMRTVVLRRLK